MSICVNRILYDNPQLKSWDYDLEEHVGLCKRKCTWYAHTTLSVKSHSELSVLGPVLYIATWAGKPLKFTCRFELVSVD